MAFAKHDEIKIYYETAGDKLDSAVLLCHGLAETSQVWRMADYVDDLSAGYHVIMTDVRGHGQSDKPHAPDAYANHKLVADVTAVLDDLNIDKVHFWGFSSGADLGWSVAQLAPDRLRSLVVGGHGPFPDEPVGEAPEIHDMLKAKGIDGLVALYKEMGGEYWSTAFEEMVRANDIEALIAYMAVNQPRDAERFVPELEMPVMGYAGEDDPRHDRVKQGCEMAPRGRFASLPGLSHFGSFMRADRVLPQVVAFMQQIEGGIRKEAGL